MEIGTQLQRTVLRRLVDWKAFVETLPLPHVVLARFFRDLVGEVKSLPSKLKPFWWFVNFVGLSILIVSIAGPRYGFHVVSGRISVRDLILAIALSCFTGLRKVRVRRDADNKKNGSLSLTSLASFAAIIRFGPAAACVIAGLSAFLGGFYPKEQTPPQIIFNTVLTCINAWIAGMIFVMLNHSTLDAGSVTALAAMLVASVIYFLINTVSVAFVLHLVGGDSVVTIWRENFSWTASSYLATATISVLGAWLLKDRSIAVFVASIPIAVLFLQSYQNRTELDLSQKQRIEDLETSKRDQAILFESTIKSLALAIDAKDQYTHQHILRVQRYSLAIGLAMGLDESDMNGLKTGALLHDIGKLGVPEYVLLKPGKLSDDEFQKIRKHPEIGEAILDPVTFPWPVKDVVKYHHERWDGKGYPSGLKGEGIPRLARILSVADTYDAMTSNRSYRGARTHQVAVEEIVKGSGTQFDPEVVRYFQEVIDGVVGEMAAEGVGPLAVARNKREVTTGVAEKAAQAIQRASMDLWSLYEVAQTAPSSLGTQDLLYLLARRIQAIYPDTLCLFLLRNNEPLPDGLTVRSAVGPNRDFFINTRTLGDRSASYRVCTGGATYVGQFDNDDLMLNGCPMLEWQPLRTCIIAPITHEREVLGTVNLYHADENGLSDQDRVVIESVAERSGMAIFNSLQMERAQSDAITDALTGVYNLRFVSELIDTLCRRCGGETEKSFHEISEVGAIGVTSHVERTLNIHGEFVSRFSVLCLDVDSFKPINDNFGHKRGNIVLRDLSRLFQEVVGDDGIVTRYGGDEFLIVLPHSGPAQAEQVAARLTAAVDSYDPRLYHSSLGSLRLGVSIGCSNYPEDAVESAGLLSVADRRMYDVKSERKLARMAVVSSVSRIAVT